MPDVMLWHCKRCTLSLISCEYIGPHISLLTATGVSPIENRSMCVAYLAVSSCNASLFLSGYFAPFVHSIVPDVNHNSDNIKDNARAQPTHLGGESALIWKNTTDLLLSWVCVVIYAWSMCTSQSLKIIFPPPTGPKERWKRQAHCESSRRLRLATTGLASLHGSGTYHLKCKGHSLSGPLCPAEGEEGNKDRSTDDDDDEAAALMVGLPGARHRDSSLAEFLISASHPPVIPSRLSE